MDKSEFLPTQVITYKDMNRMLLWVQSRMHNRWEIYTESGNDAMKVLDLMEEYLSSEKH